MNSKTVTRLATLVAMVGLTATGLPAEARTGAGLDPTRPPLLAGNDSRPGGASWHLGSVLISDQRQVAVINGQVVAVGDQVQGARVASISEREVLLHPGNGADVVVLTMQTIKVRPDRPRLARSPDGAGSSGR